MMLAAYYQDETPITAQDFYAIACNPARHVVVSACAGGGKTWVLIARMLQALLGTTQTPGCLPQEILAITFTKKAAGEMRERLYAQLATLAQSDLAFARQTLMNWGIAAEEAVLLAPRLQGLYEQTLSQGSVSIRTFHSWFAALLRNAPLSLHVELGLPIEYTLLEDDAAERDALWPRFYAAVLKDAALKADYYAQTQFLGRHSLLEAFNAALDQRLEFACADAVGSVRTALQPVSYFFPHYGDSISEILQGDSRIKQDFYQAAQYMLQASQKKVAELGQTLLNAIAQQDLQSALAVLLTQKGEARKFNENLAGFVQIQACQDEALKLNQALKHEAAYAHHVRMTRLVRVLLQEWKQLKLEKAWVDMGDLEMVSRVLLSESVLSGWIQERLDLQIKQLLIDEFQDTNPLQWQVLQSWLSSYAGAGAGLAPSVFIVGDAKQSIYRFRRADPVVFAAARDFVCHGLGGVSLSCEHTRRLSQAVVAEVNTVFSTLQAAGQYENFKPHTTEQSEIGECIRIPFEASRAASSHTETDVWRDSLTTPRVLAEETRQAQQAQQVALWVKAAIEQGTLPGDIMVLARKNDTLSHLSDALRREHVPVQWLPKTHLVDMPEVQDVIALLEALLLPTHNLSLARAFRSPLLGLDDQDLVCLAQACRHPQSWWEVLHIPVSPEDTDMESESAGMQCKAQTTVITSGIARICNAAVRQADQSSVGIFRWNGYTPTSELTDELKAAANQLKTCQDLLQQYPAYEALHAIYTYLDVFTRYEKFTPTYRMPSVRAHLQAVLQVLLDLDDVQWQPHRWLQALKTSSATAPTTATQAAVQLLTVHSAKGLEAHTVVAVDTQPARTAKRFPAHLVWHPEENAPRSFVFRVSDKWNPLGIESELREEAKREQIEQANVHYVALTRAQTRLVIFHSDTQ